MSGHNGIRRHFARWPAPVLCALTFVFLSPSIHAEGLRYGDAAPLWWSGVFESNSVSAPGTPDDILAPRRPAWGLKGPLYLSSAEPGETVNFDVKRKLFGFSDRSFLAVGLGWNELGLDHGIDSAGARLSVEGRWGIGSAWSLYGQSVWIPALEDSDEYLDVAGNGFEAGLAFQPLPNMSFRAGYRSFRIDFTDGRTGIDDSSTSSGVLLGAGIRF